MYLRLPSVVSFILLLAFSNMAFSQQGPGLQWAGAMGGSSFDAGNSITTDDQHNVYVTGNFSGTADFDFGSGTSIAISNGSDDIFIQKLDFAGNLIWAKTIGGTGIDVGADIKLDTSGNIYILGYFKNTVDFNPGIGIQNLTTFTNSKTDLFILKLDIAGNFIWVKQFGGTGNTVSVSMAIDHFSNLYITGNFSGTSDMNPGTGVSNITSQGNNDVFVQKLDSNGNFIWVRNFGSVLADYGNRLMVDLIGNVFIIGNFQGTVDFNPGISVYNLISNGGSDIFIQKLDSNGIFLWAKKFGSTSSSEFNKNCTLDSLSNIYITGFFSGTVDFDPGSGISNQTSNGTEDVFIQKLDSSGNFQWVNILGGSGYDKGLCITTSKNGGIYFGGYLPIPGGAFGLIQKLDFSLN